MIKAIKRDSSGVSPLKENRKLLTETSEKVNALNRPSEHLEKKLHLTMPDIHITQKGVEHPLLNLPE